ncbi:nitric oxide reductase NorE protein [Aminobacter lissarensis]|uniref:Nitric oxide reductase NorE protein n=1 Tax=Aminobacter carboxidus TaxID=376165 RepID=A0A8E2BBB2_9HYPH|nr:cytochrome c oxidase subunit 3 [Aminobacter lissarensis]MBB6464919.1 nitric oxide reductase NorE protein [Aminobacter lissarensis]
MEAATLATQAVEETDGSDDFLLWILVWSELAAFGLLLGAFLVASVLQIDQFAAARLHLNTPLAAINTAVLLTSGWQAALATSANASRNRARGALVRAALLGFLFVAIKLAEYSGEIGFAGDDAYGVFFELYFLLTGFHLMHVVFGAFVLLVVSVRAAPANTHLIATLWHTFDLIWIVMFPIVYLA